MTSSELRAALVLPLLAAAACGGSGSTGSTTRTPSTPQVIGTIPSGPNVVPIGVNGAACPGGGYLNEPCVSVTVCVPGTATCQEIGGLLLDTGSTGLRIFSQALSIALPRTTAGAGQTLGECIGYLDGSFHWGPVAAADVVLGGEPAVTVPIQIIDAGFASRPSRCATAQSSPAVAGFNGILGVAPFEQDCGTGCQGTASNGFYYACGASCSGTTLAVASQVTNPVSALSQDGNGVVVELPAIPAGGAGMATGALVLGIGTRTNNVPSASAVAFPLDPASGELGSAIGAVSGAGFLDTGSNGLFFEQAASPALATCASSASWFCPSSPLTLPGTIAGAQGSPSANVSVRISSLDALDLAANVSSEVAGPAPASSGIDWGLPFHFGRDVFVGIENRSSSLGAGPLVAY